MPAPVFQSYIMRDSMWTQIHRELAVLTGCLAITQMHLVLPSSLCADVLRKQRVFNSGLTTVVVQHSKRTYNVCALMSLYIYMLLTPSYLRNLKVSFS